MLNLFQHHIINVSKKNAVSLRHAELVSVSHYYYYYY